MTAKEAWRAVERYVDAVAYLNREYPGHVAGLFSGGCGQAAYEVRNVARDAVRSLERFACASEDEGLLDWATAEQVMVFPIETKGMRGFRAQMGDLTAIDKTMRGALRFLRAADSELRAAE